MADFLNSPYSQPTSFMPEGMQTDYLTKFQQSVADTNKIVSDSIGTNLNVAGVNGTNSNPFSGFFTNDQGGAGWGVSALGAGMGLAQTFLGFNQLSEGKKQNKIAQNQWQQQFDIQKSEYDRRVSERAQRIANNNAAKKSIGG